MTHSKRINNLLTLCLLFAEAVSSAGVHESTKWEVIIKTCDDKGSGTDANVYLKLFYQDDHNQESFELDTDGRDDFERSQRDHFKLDLAQIDVINIGLYWWPSGTIGEHWCADWVVMLNAATNLCYSAYFHKWIDHYSDPPTYPQEFKSANYKDCVQPL